MSKFTRVGQMTIPKNPDYRKDKNGNDRYQIKIDKTITLREGEYLDCYVPTPYTKDDGTVVEPQPFVVMNVLKRNSDAE